jgi:integrase
LPQLEALARELLAERFSRGTVKVDLAYLRAALNIARKRGVLIKGKTVKITRRADFPTIEVDNARQGFFEDHQYQAVCGAIARNGPHGPMLPDVVRFYYLSGWRGQEILNLPWAYVDRRERLITLPATGSSKRKKDRTLPLDYHLESGEWANAELWQLIERRWPARIVGSTLCPLVFHRAGRPIRSFAHLWKKACREAGVVGRIPHDFRRTRVRNLVNDGVPEKVAMSWTGHVTREVFDRYHIVTAEDQRRAMAAMAGRRPGKIAVLPAQNHAQSASAASGSGR